MLGFGAYSSDSLGVCPIGQGVWGEAPSQKLKTFLCVSQFLYFLRDIVVTVHSICTLRSQFKLQMLQSKSFSQHH